MKLAVIGRGLIGSAAARHLSAAGYDVTLIGPSEPADFAAHPGVFASHYDEGRITRGLDPNPFWSRVSRASIARYRAIEAQSGVPFYSEVGVLMTGPQDHPPIRDVARIAQEAGIDCDVLDNAALAARFAYFRFADGMTGVFEARNAGYISPRSLVRAQGVCVRQNGGRILAAEVQGIDEIASGVVLTTGAGQHQFDRVLVATGGFSQALLGGAQSLEVCARTVVLLRLGAQEQARLAGMPSHIDLTRDGIDPYQLPPIRYPDGQVWIKQGGDPEDVALATSADVRDWYRAGGSQKAAAYIEDVIRSKIPDLQAEERIIKPCVTSYTKDGLPDIRRLSERLSVAIGGNGKGAKNSDELGRLGAEMLVGQTVA